MMINEFCIVCCCPNCKVGSPFPCHENIRHFEENCKRKLKSQCKSEYETCSDYI